MVIGTHSLTYTHSFPPSLTHSLTHTRSFTHSHTHTHTHTHTASLTHSRTHARAHTCFLLLGLRCMPTGSSSALGRAAPQAVLRMPTGRPLSAKSPLTPRPASTRLQRCDSPASRLLCSSHFALPCGKECLVHVLTPLSALSLRLACLTDWPERVHRSKLCGRGRRPCEGFHHPQQLQHQGLLPVFVQSAFLTLCPVWGSSWRRGRTTTILLHSLLHSPPHTHLTHTHTLLHSLTHSLTHSPTHPLNHSLTHSLTLSPSLVCTPCRRTRAC